MRITMLETRRGSEDGHTVRRFCQGETYDVRYLLAFRLVRAGWARLADDDSQEVVDVNE